MTRNSRYIRAWSACAASASIRQKPAGSGGGGCPSRHTTRTTITRRIKSPTERAVIGADLRAGLGEHHVGVSAGRDKGARRNPSALRRDMVHQIDEEADRVTGAQPGAVGEILAALGHRDRRMHEVQPLPAR